MDFQITIEPSGRTFMTAPDETILASAIRQNIGLPYGCKDGACGSCKCKKLEGKVLHREYQNKFLSAEEEAQGYILTCRAVPETAVILESRHVTDESSFPVKKMPVRINKLEKKSQDVMLLSLQLPANDLFRYHAGQYVEFILKDGSRRAYSMANAPYTQEKNPHIELHIRHMPNGKFTDHVFSAMKEKEILRLEGPFGSFFLREDESSSKEQKDNFNSPMIFLASGTGFAPIKALIEQIEHDKINRPITLYWGARRPHDLYLNDWVLDKQKEMPNLRYVPVVSDALPEDAWNGRTGFVHQAVADDFDDLSAYQVYACGAPIVVESARQALIQNHHLPEAAFFADSFISEADKHSKN